MSPTSDGLTFGWEPLAQLLDDGAENLVCQHYREVARHQNAVQLDLDWEEMLREEEAGRFKVFAARRDGRLIGYLTFRLFHPDRYRSTLYINADVFWMAPEERGKGSGMRMFQLARDALPRPAKMQWRRKIGIEDDRVDRILRTLGLEPEDVVYTGVLD